MAASRDGAGGGGDDEDDDDDDDEGGDEDEEDARKPARAGAAGAARARERGTSCSARRSREACAESPGTRVKACILTKISEVRFLAA
jgi:hypothetical protein